MAFALETKLEEMSIGTLITSAATFAALSDVLADVSSNDELERHLACAFNRFVELIDGSKLGLAESMHINLLSIALGSHCNIEVMSRNITRLVETLDQEIERRINAKTQADRPTR